MKLILRGRAFIKALGFRGNGEGLIWALFNGLMGSVEGVLIGRDNFMEYLHYVKDIE